MGDIHRRRKLQPQCFGNKRAEPNYVRQFFPNNRDCCHSNLRGVTDTLKVDCDPEEETKECETSIDSILRSMMVARHRVQEKETQLRKSDKLVSSHGRALRGLALPDEVIIIAVDD